MATQVEGKDHTLVLDEALASSLLCLAGEGWLSLLSLYLSVWLSLLQEKGTSPCLCDSRLFPSQRSGSLALLLLWRIGNNDCVVFLTQCPAAIPLRSSRIRLTALVRIRRRRH